VNGPGRGICRLIRGGSGQAGDDELLATGATVLRGQALDEDFDSGPTIGIRDLMQIEVRIRLYPDEIPTLDELSHLRGSLENAEVVCLGLGVLAIERRRRTTGYLTLHATREQNEACPEKGREGSWQAAGTPDVKDCVHCGPRTLEVRFFETTDLRINK
jgi:hypothetical protein